MNEMVHSPKATVIGIDLWMRGFESLDAWVAQKLDAEVTKPKGLGLDRINRRRASLLARAIADASAGAMAKASVDPATIQTVVGSSIGEAERMIGLLDQMWRTKLPMSPMAFAMSVHNAASGLMSISNKNRGFTTSIAADYDTPGMALVEAFGILETMKEPVLVVCGDESSPPDFVPEEESFSLFSVAIVLAPIHQNTTSLGELSMPHLGTPTIEAPQFEPGITRNPQVGLLDLVHAITHRATGTLRLDRGNGYSWCVDVNPLHRP